MDQSETSLENWHEYGFLLKPEKREEGLMRRESSPSDVEMIYGADDDAEKDPLNAKRIRSSARTEDWWIPLKKQAMNEFTKGFYKPNEDEMMKITSKDKLIKHTSDNHIMSTSGLSGTPINENIKVKAMDSSASKEGEEKEKQETERGSLECKPSEYPRITERVINSFFIEGKGPIGTLKKIYRNINKVYQFRGRIRNGTYTTVNKYYSRFRKKEIAIKIIPKTGGIPPQRLFHFVPRELDVAEDKKFTHKNIVEFYETYDIGLRCYIMMEYVENGTLSEYILSKGRLDPATYQRFFRHLLKAVNFCHSYGVCHRKISTDNCLISKDHVLKLCDFSYCRPITDREQLSTTFCGVLGFTAPEILMCRSYYPCLAEAWSCGVILFTMVYGSMPFDSCNFAKLLKQVLHPIKFHWYCDTPYDAVNIMHKAIAPVKRRWSIERLLGHSWVSPPTKAGYEYYKNWCKENTMPLSELEIRKRLLKLKNLIQEEYVTPLLMKQKEGVDDFEKLTVDKNQDINGNCENLSEDNQD